MAMQLPRLNMKRQAARLQDETRDTWNRLKPWVRTLIRAVVVMAMGLLLGYLLALRFLPADHKQPVDHTVSVTVPAAPVTKTVSVAPPPSVAHTDGTPVEPQSAPDNTEALRALLNTKIELREAPLQSLLIASQDGMLPRISDDGVEPWRAYSRPQAPLPKGVAAISIVVVDAGISQAETPAALAGLPGQVDFAFNIYSPSLPDQINAARAAGHEVLVDVPMEPDTFPLDDPGPETLLTQFTAAQNLRQFHNFLARAPGVFAVTSSSGNQFLTEDAALAPLLQDLKKRGIAWVDLSTKDGSTATTLAIQLQLPMAPKSHEDVYTLDTVLTPAAMQVVLNNAVAHARLVGSAIIIAHTYPLSVKTLAAFIDTLPASNIGLVPVSALLAVPEPKVLAGPPLPPPPPRHSSPKAVQQPTAPHAENHKDTHEEPMAAHD